MKDLIGQTLGQYRIEALLGEGNIGQVFRAKHVRRDQTVAIKVIHEHFSTLPTFRTRFLQEARSTAALKHPNVVEIYEFGEQHELLYLVMELLMGGTLTTLLRQPSTKDFAPVGQSHRLIFGLDLMRQAAEGLAAAHALGMIHRDIKPDNMLLRRMHDPDRSNEQYQLKISDLGLARLAERSGLSTATPIGTLAYMSPEQCQDKKLDGRSDLYSLGVVLYEVVTGHLPFQINTFSDAVQKHVHASPLSPQQLRPDLPPFIEQIILRCLAKAPEKRYQTGKELAKALQAAINNAGLQTIAPLILPSPLSPQEKIREGNKEADRPRSQKTPYINVSDQSGQTIKVVELTRQGLTVGRQNDCDIMLSAETISRHHLNIKWDGKQTTITDLGSSYGTKLGKKQLTPQISQPWDGKQPVSVGPFVLHLEIPEATEERPQRPPKPEVKPLPAESRFIPGPPSLVANNRIGVRLEPKKLTITPGQPTQVRVALVNLGSTVDWFSPVVEGVPEEWVQGQGQEVHLNPAMQKDVELRINVTKIPENQAREYPVTIRATSREKPEESGADEGRWIVLPFWDDGLAIQPSKAAGRGAGNYTVTVRNHGNAAERYELSGEDAEEKLVYHFKPSSEVIVEPGKQVRIPLKVKTRRFWFGPEKPHPFQIYATPAAKRRTYGQAQITAPNKNAELVNKAIIPSWFFRVALAIVAVLVILALAIATLPRLFSQNGNGPVTTTQITPTPAIVTATPTPVATVLPTTATVDQNTQILNQARTGTPAFNDLLLTQDGNNWDQNPNCAFMSSTYQATIQAKPDPRGSYIPCEEKASTFNNFAYQVDMNITQGDGGGIIFRDDGQNHNYLFFVRANGGYLIETNSGKTQSNSGTSPAIKTGLNQTNTLTVVAQNNTVNFYVNDHFITVITDQVSNNGILGVLADEITNPTTVQYSNAKVWKL